MSKYIIAKRVLFTKNLNHNTRGENEVKSSFTYKNKLTKKNLSKKIEAEIKADATMQNAMKNKKVTKKKVQSSSMKGF